METIEALCARYRVDLEHAQHVATLATGLFDALHPIHQLNARMRELLEAAALVHNVGMSVDAANHHTAGRDIVVAAPLAGYDQVERVMLACMVAFHRKAVLPEREALFAALGEAHRRPTLILSAILRIADGLDYSQTQTTQLAEVDMESEPEQEEEDDGGAAGDDQPGPTSGTVSGEVRTVRVRAQGPYSHEDAGRATKKADLWNSLFPLLTASGRMTRPGLTQDMTLAEAGRRILRYQLDSLAPDEWVLPRGRALSAAARRPHPGNYAPAAFHAARVRLLLQE